MHSLLGLCEAIKSTWNQAKIRNTRRTLVSGDSRLLSGQKPKRQRRKLSINGDKSFNKLMQSRELKTGQAKGDFRAPIMAANFAVYSVDWHVLENRVPCIQGGGDC